MIGRIVSWFKESNRIANEKAEAVRLAKLAKANSVITSSTSKIPGWRIVSIHGTLIASDINESETLINLRLLAHEAGCNAVINVKCLSFGSGFFDNVRVQGDAVIAQRRESLLSKITLFFDRRGLKQAH